LGIRLLRFLLILIGALFLFSQQKQIALIRFFLPLAFCFIQTSRVVRPYNFSSLFLIILGTWIVTNPSKTKNEKIWIFILSVLWVNLHGGALVFIPILLFLMVGDFFYVWAVPSSEARSEFFHRTCNSMIIVFSFVLTPHPIALFQRAFTGISYPTMDWRSLQFWTNWPNANLGHFVIITVFFTLLMRSTYLVFSNEQILPAFIRLLLFSMGCFALLLYKYRFFECILIPIYALSCFEAKYVYNITKGQYNYKFFMVVLCLIILFLISWHPRKTNYEGIDELSAFLKSHQNCLHIFTPYHFAGRIIFHAYPNCRVFIDTRLEQFIQQDIYKTYIEILAGDIPAQPIFEKHDVNMIVWPLNDMPAEMIHNIVPFGWKLTFKNKSFLIYQPV
jgi:hypothetical protein